jgi:AcrR family transcriptional regulator
VAKITRKDWIEEGFHILVEEGDGALTVDALCARMGRSKGSFYHHFAGRPGYVEALLDTWERQATDRLIETGQSDAPVEDRLRAVNRQAAELRNARLERAIRGWAANEPLAGEVQDRVDRRRLGFLEELCAERMGEGPPARLLARIFQLAFVGAQHLDPPLEGDELYETFRFLDPLFDL